MTTTNGAAARAATVRGHPLVGVLPELVRDGPGLCVRAMRANPRSVARLRVGPASIYMVHHPDHVQHVLVENNRNYWKGRAFNRASFVFGRGLVLNEGESWLHQRRLISPAFSHARVAGLVPIMADVVRRRADAWDAAARAGQPVEMVREMMTITLEIIARTMFSLGVTDDDVRRMAAAFHTILGHVSLRFATFWLPDRIPLPGSAKARAAIGVLEEVVRRVVAERRASGERPDDLLSMLLDARDAATGEGMGDRQLRDEVLTTLFGGYEATADALAWTWHLLARHPEADARFRAELDEVVAGDTPTAEELGRLDYTRRLIMESMRVYPPFWWILRSAREDDVVGGQRIPAGATVLVVSYATHRHPDFWKDPERFDPDRFLPESMAGRHRHAYIPFGTGQRACVGRHLAMLETPLALAMFAKRFRPVPVAGREVVYRAEASLRARDGVWMRLEPGGVRECVSA
ncbi:MAG TPA: cytochrome P450 [Longimicrobium sp.]|nr:cytochrome P450 [Longimicrobium sp.]